MDLGSVESKFSYCLRTGKLIPDPWYVPDKLRTGARDLGSVGPMSDCIFICMRVSGLN